jgi:hypothetical protein
VRYATHRYREDELLPLFRRFLAQVDRLVTAIDQLRVR